MSQITPASERSTCPMAATRVGTRATSEGGYGRPGTPGAVLRAARAFRGWSQQELAERAALSRWTVCRIERGHEDPYWRTVERLCRALDLSAEALFPPEPATDRSELPGGR